MGKLTLLKKFLPDSAVARHFHIKAVLTQTQLERIGNFLLVFYNQIFRSSMAYNKAANYKLQKTKCRYNNAKRPFLILF